MRLAAALALGAALLTSPAAADSAVVYPSTAVQTVPNGTIVYSEPMVNSSGQFIQSRPYPSAAYSSQPQSFFGRLMELERRKNAWIRQRLFGR